MLAPQVDLINLRGGHSGIDVAQESLNAILALCRVLTPAVQTEGDGARLVSITGGTSTNAIPREATAVVVASAAHISAIEAEFVLLRAEVSANEPNAAIEIRERSLNEDEEAMDGESSRRCLSFIFAVGNGVVRKILSSGDTECSYNLGVVSTSSSTMTTKYLVRSTSHSWMQYFAKQLSGIGALVNAKVDAFQAFFGAWEPNFQSKVVQDLKNCHPRLPASDIRVYTIHAGLECATLLERFELIGRKGVECASIGPQIEHAHSPDECLFIKSGVEFVHWVESMVIRA